ncbi:valine--tRNA ligase [Candidatus Pacearchaeota archaeon]|nr:valine--tRNA ligase [Candidatus Pacearchaeota archaeon]
MEKPEMSKNWTLDNEKSVIEEWRCKNPFSIDLKSKKIYSIDTPPPYVNSPVHIGQAITYCYMDFFARYKRMKGFSVVFPLGLDRNGLPIEMAAEKKFKVDPSKVSREKFIGYCKKILEESSNVTMDTFLRMGVSFSSYDFGEKIGDAYMTDSEYYRSLTQSTFVDMWKKDMIYEDKKVVNYCPGCKTTLADAEIEYSDKETTLIHLRFKVKETGEEIIIATTRPELLGSCVNVLFNPKDERYKNLNGKTAITPYYDKEIKIISHPSAEMKFGSGLLMMCSFGDLTDIRFFREQKIEPIILISENGLMNKKSGDLEGLKIKEARKKIIEELKNKNIVIREENVSHRSPICERSKDSVEFIEMQEFYMKQIEFKRDLLKLQKKMKFYDESSRKILENWIESISQDWPLSRRRYYATPIPLWRCPKCKEFIISEKGKYIEPWKIEKKCKKCKVKAIPETRVFDTWFDSSISDLFILGYERNSEFFKRAFPCSLRPQGKEIIRTWLYYTFLRAYLLTGKACFKDVWINYHILDENKRKMSKSKGNVIDPKEILNNYGSEALRLWSAIEGDLTKTDFGCSQEKIRAEMKTLTKLWNVTKFLMQFPNVKKPKKIQSVDKLFINHIDYLENYCDNRYSKYDFFHPSVKLRGFLWDIFASNYIEIIKSRAYNQDNKFNREEQESAFYTLRYILEKMLKLFYPILPMITYKLYNILGKNIFNEKLKDHREIDYDSGILDELMNTNSIIWKLKKEKSLALNSPVKAITINKKLIDFEKDLRMCHNASEINYGSEVGVEV